jgi:hypothetical protein
MAVIGGQKTNSPKVRQSFPGQASYLPEMPEPKIYEFSKHICALCATRGTDVFRLGAKLGIDPIELLQMSFTSFGIAPSDQRSRIPSQQGGRADRGKAQEALPEPEPQATTVN